MGRIDDMAFLYEKLAALREAGVNTAMPPYIYQNLNPNFELRPYQIEAFENFITYFEGKLCQKPTQVLFHMATGSGKTLMMAGLIIYLYKQGYRNFLFFVNLSNIVEKTKVNFLDSSSSKYLFNEDIIINGERIPVQEVDNFQYADTNAINICFSTTQGLHTDLWMTKENSMSFDDFDNKKVVLISDEAHHLNVDTKKKMSKTEAENYHSWQSTVEYIFHKNKDNILLEFTATCDLTNPAIKAEYESKIIFNYPLANFYQDRYSKDIITFRRDLPLDERVLLALILSQYRMKLFQSHRLFIKPVVLFKSAKIADSKEFMEHFIERISHLSGADIQHVKSNIPQDDSYNQGNTNGATIILKAFEYFDKHQITLEALAQELRDEFSAEHCISVNDEKDAENKQILLNSLEDRTNPYRAIFEVKKLDEGWDVLNLFDIVRLYETRQSGGKKISQATIAEAQLIGRGARYCPFQLNDEQPKFKRKYDDDVTNEMRVCEQLYYHCQNDHRYVTELHQALREIGLNPDNMIQREYKLKDSFKKTDIYRNGLVFLNKRKLKSRKDVHGLQPRVKNNIYLYAAPIGAGGTDEVMDDKETSTVDIQQFTSHMTIKQIADINYAIVNKAIRKFPIYKFNTLQSYFPNLKSTREFITSDDYLGSVKIDIKSRQEEPDVKILYDAVVDVVKKIGETISNIKETYEGTNEFFEQHVNEVFRDKIVNYTAPENGGVGISQNDSSVPSEYKIDLIKEDWFAYNDNYGTSEEKAFVAYFKSYIEELKKNYEDVYLVRNEREFHIYSFDDGERFEPDYVIFLRKAGIDGFEQIQIFVEPKGTHLLDKDSWKEKFLIQMQSKAIPVKKFKDDNKYTIWGIHFFNRELRTQEFNTDFKQIVNGKIETVQFHP